MTQEILKQELKEKTKIKKPKKYKVIIFNDDFTPFLFVEKILMVIYNKTEVEAHNLAQEIHQKGKAQVGVYSLDIAQTKKEQTIANSINNGFPLLCEIEPTEE